MPLEKIEFQNADMDEVKINLEVLTRVDFAEAMKYHIRIVASRSE